MRLDKFLKVSRLIKQRQKAKDLCDAGVARVNGKIVKAGCRIKPGDVIDIIVGNRSISADVLKIPSGNVSKHDAGSLVNIREEHILDEN
jgi:ribosomal 50S subunit-recycling heat shock protein